MTLTIQTEEDDQRQLKVTVEVPEERVQAQMRRTARALSRQVRIPGFRRGKVPYRVLVNRLGERAVRGEAIEEILEPIVEEALEQLFLRVGVMKLSLVGECWVLKHGISTLTSLTLKRSTTYISPSHIGLMTP